jgi:lysozyme
MMLTDREIFDLIQNRRGQPLSDEDRAAVNAVLYPNNAPPPDTYDRVVLEAELTRDEGEKFKAYKDTKGKWTIGIGHNLDDCGTYPLNRTVADVLANGVNQAEIDELFAWDIERADKDLDRALPWWRALDPVRQRVMLNMCFNMGIGSAKLGHGLCSFVNTVEHIHRGEYPQAADGMLASAWAKEVGSRAQRLADMMRNGQ